MREKSRSLMEQYEQVYMIMQHIQGFIQHGFEFGSSPLRGQGRVLSILKLQPEISQKELGYLLDMRNQSLGELLTKLEKKGYIMRTPSEQDRRTMNIILTDAGREAAEQVEQKQSSVDQLFSFLSEEEQEQLRELLIKMEKGLTKEKQHMLDRHHEDGRPKRPRRPPHSDRGPRFFDQFRGSPFGPGDGRPPFGGFSGFEDFEIEDEEENDEE